MTDWGRVKETLIEFISDETGIGLKPEDMDIAVEDDSAKLLLHGSELSRIDVDYLQEDEDTIADILFEETDHLKKRLTEARKSHLTPVIEGLLMELTSLSQGIDHEIRDYGYTPGRHWETEEEYSRGYPDVCVVFTRDGEPVAETRVDLDDEYNPIKIEDVRRQLKKG